MTSDSTETTKMRFELLRAGLADGAARLGRLALTGRPEVLTPNFFAVTSRGAIPHITPDNLKAHVPVPGTYIALEDFIERSQQDPTRKPPIYSTPSSSSSRPLHTFTATPPSTLTLLAARRLPAVRSPAGNTPNAVSIFTSTGFQNLSVDDYRTAVDTLKPDMAIPLADLTNTPTTPNSKRAVRMAERTEEWLVQSLSFKDSFKDTAVFAPTLPIPYAMQWEYLTRLADDFAQTISGLAVYSADILPDLPSHPALDPLARLSLDPPATPHALLRQIGLGADIFVLPFVNGTSDAGVALTFTFPPEKSDSGLMPLGEDLSDEGYAMSLTPLRKGCRCYACTSHSAAYIHHLLAAREMLGWTLLQIHNHAVLADFFAGIRASLEAGDFEKDSVAFQTVYEADIPVGTGERPRARGYHFKSEGGDVKRNRKGWGKLGAEDGETGVEGGVKGLEIGEVEKARLERDLTETPVVLEEVEGGAKELAEHGMGVEKKE
jgi:queuine tRNA-ribosyltransferase subunit QTRTD1